MGAPFFAVLEALWELSGSVLGGSGRFVKKIGKKVGRYLAEVPPEVPPPPGEVPPGCSGLHKLVRTHPRRVKRAAGAPAARLRRALQGRPRREVPPRRYLPGGTSPEVPPRRYLPGGRPEAGRSPRRLADRVFPLFETHHIFLQKLLQFDTIFPRSLKRFGCSRPPRWGAGGRVERPAGGRPEPQATQ